MKKPMKDMSKPHFQKSCVSAFVAHFSIKKEEKRKKKEEKSVLNEIKIKLKEEV